MALQGWPFHTAKKRWWRSQLFIDANARRALPLRAKKKTFIGINIGGLAGQLTDIFTGFHPHQSARIDDHLQRNKKKSDQ